MGPNFQVRARNVNGLKQWFDKLVEMIVKLTRKILGNWKLHLGCLARGCIQRGWKEVGCLVVCPYY